MKLIGIKDARDRLRELAELARDGKEAVVLTMRGVPSVMLVPVNEDDLDIADAFLRELRDTATRVKKRAK
jgi:prevent-host-death family protein